MIKAWTCYLLKSSPRYLTWRAILDSDEVSIKNPIAFTANFAGEQVEAHAPDLSRLDTNQRWRRIYK